MDPSTILYSRPTLCEPTPEVDSSVTVTRGPSLREDGWRQIEFVAPQNRDYIKDELVRAKTFCDAHRKRAGWSDIYLRREHPTPLVQVGLMYDDLSKPLEFGLSLGQAPVIGGFSLCATIDDWFLYGVRDAEDRVVHLGLGPTEDTPSADFIHALMDIAREGNVLLVDWYNFELVNTSSVKSVIAWLNG